jgi:hypothetical protein
VTRNLLPDQDFLDGQSNTGCGPDKLSKASTRSDKRSSNSDESEIAFSVVFAETLFEDPSRAPILVDTPGGVLISEYAIPSAIAVPFQFFDSPEAVSTATFQRGKLYTNYFQVGY